MAIDNIRDQLKRDEGTVLYAYADSFGYQTIGTGRLIDRRRGGGISQAESDYLLDNDIREKRAQVIAQWPWVAMLDNARASVLVNMAFQLGTAGLTGFANTLELIKAGNYSAASTNMLASKWAQQTPARAQRLAKQMATGVWQ